jgi:NADH:ubiquinone oxidoreductase subunit C
MTHLETLAANLKDVLGGRLAGCTTALGEVTVELRAADHLEACLALRDDPRLRFEQCVDLCGMDYLNHGDGAWQGRRYAVVLHLLSVTHNWRLRVRSFCDDDDLPLVASLIPVWPSANWFEREAFDRVRGPPGPAADPDRLRLRRPSVPQGLPGVGLRGDALRPRAAPRGLPAAVDRAARGHSARDPRGQLRAGALTVADIKNYTLNFAVCRPRSAGLTCAARRLAAAEIELRPRFAGGGSFDGGR